MAYSKIILNGETLMDVTSDTVDAGNLLSGKTATKNSGAKVTGNIATKSSSDLTVSGATVTAPAGYYSAAASKAVATTTHPNPTATITSSTGVVTASHTQGTGYVTGGTTTGTLNLTTQAAQTINTSTADQTIASNRWLTGTQTIKSVTTTNLTAANIAEGVTVKVGDANNASRITQITGTHSGETQYTATITNSGNATYCYVSYGGTKYYSNNGSFSFKAGDTLTIYCRGNDLLINGEEQALTSYSYTMTLPIGDIDIEFAYTSSTVNGVFINTYVKPEDTYEISSSGTFNVYGYAQAWVPSGETATPAKTITTNPTMTLASTTGVVTATYSGSSSITPTIVSGYVTASTTTAGTVSTTGTSTFQLTSKAAATYNTSTADQTVPSYRWLTGTQTIKSVTTSNLTAANIASGVVVKVGDANNASRITQVTGTYAPATSSLTVTPTETAQTFNATGVYGYKPVTVNAISSTYVGTGVTMRSSADVTFTESAGQFAVYSGYYSSTFFKDITRYGGGNFYPSKNDQIISSYMWLNSSITIKSVIISNLTASNIVNGVVVKIGDVSNASRITQITGTYAGIIPTGTSTITSNGTYDVTNYASASVSVAGGSFYGIYYALAQSNDLCASGSRYTPSYTSEEVSAWCDSFSTIQQLSFAGRRLNGSFTFNNANYVSKYAFAIPYYNVTMLNGGPAYMDFPKASYIGQCAFTYNTAIRTFNASSCTSIYNAAFMSCAYLSDINFPQVISIGTQAFQQCSNLITINFPSATSISQSAFYYCNALTEVNLPMLSIIASSTFEGCQNLISINISRATSIGANAFNGCTQLASISFPSVSHISNYAFSNCKSLVSIYFPSCTYVGTGAFTYCTSIISLNFPLCSSTGLTAFGSCTALTTVSLPTCTILGSSTFINCQSLININLPACTHLSNSVFTSCINLQTVSLPSCSYIEMYCFMRCYNLLSLYLLGSSVVSIANINVFSSTPMSNYTTSTGGVYGKIYVPSSLYNSYITAATWKTISARIVSV